MSDKQPWDELYVDLEDDRSAAVFMVAFDRLNQHFVQRLGHPMSSRAVSSGKLKRMIVKLPRPTKSIHERHLLQVCLGASPHSELLSWIYLEEGKAPAPPVDEDFYTRHVPEPAPPMVFTKEETGLPFDIGDDPDLPFK
jgi:hypothetical protein